eukprot:CAMPEP_0197242910 /NCGR_PEP_ID=MMETSP1429-20130617/8518_1 /TAXON_ID=49237 /ORGANISM="Chaetoceros  sp., Strain UNC1202" /LENGTH=166 /DNA_ID=CAMNT_0042703029 /DNA_START=15 /DNA_END=512 /DNA_ORIENTATION=-
MGDFFQEDGGENAPLTLSKKELVRCLLFGFTAVPLLPVLLVVMVTAAVPPAPTAEGPNGIAVKSSSETLGNSLGKNNPEIRSWGLAEQPTAAATAEVHPDPNQYRFLADSGLGVRKLLSDKFDGENAAAALEGVFMFTLFVLSVLEDLANPPNRAAASLAISICSW